MNFILVKKLILLLIVSTPFAISQAAAGGMGDECNYWNPCKKGTLCSQTAESFKTGNGVCTNDPSNPTW
ncbi:MAG: hypothetical protein H0U75_10505 [Legionella sp.]|nr:hypothetical protein [Legionella sp.]